MTICSIVNRVDTWGAKGVYERGRGITRNPRRSEMARRSTRWRLERVRELALNCDIGHTLKSLRKSRGLTQKDLACRVDGGLDYTYIGKIERGEQLPSLKILMGLSAALGVPVSLFFQEESPVANTPFTMADSAVKPLELQKELRQLHPDDVPLVVEIVKALNRHRKAERKRSYQSAPEPLPLAAEDGPSYGKP